MAKLSYNSEMDNGGITDVPVGVSSTKKKGRRFLLGLVLVIVLAGGALYAFRTDAWAQKQGWQAVFLNNGQAYFGHLVGRSGDTYTLSNVFYLRTSQTFQPTD